MPQFNDDVRIGGQGTDIQAHLLYSSGIILVEKKGVGNALFFSPGVSLMPVPGQLPAAELMIGTKRLHGKLAIQDQAGKTVFYLDGQKALLTIGGQGNEGNIWVRNSADANDP